MVSKCKETLKEAGWFTLRTAAVSAAIYGSVYAAIPAIGLPINSIAAGTVASYYQSKYLHNCVLKDGALTLIKKVSIKGLSVATKVGAIAAVKTASGIYTVFKNIQKYKEKTKNLNDNTNDATKRNCQSDEEYDEKEEKIIIEINEKEKHLQDAEWEDIQWPDDLIES